MTGANATVAVVEIGRGNIGAVAKMQRRVAERVRFATTPDQIAGADRIGAVGREPAPQIGHRALKGNTMLQGPEGRRRDAR